MGDGTRRRVRRPTAAVPVLRATTGRTTTPLPAPSLEGRGSRVVLCRSLCLPLRGGGPGSVGSFLEKRVMMRAAARRLTARPPGCSLSPRMGGRVPDSPNFGRQEENAPWRA